MRKGKRVWVRVGGFCVRRIRGAEGLEQGFHRGGFICFQRQGRQLHGAKDGLSPPSAYSMISSTTKHPPVSRASCAPLRSTSASKGPLAAARISAVRKSASFLLVRARAGSVEARVASSAGVKWRGVRGTIRWKIARRPCGLVHSVSTCFVTPATRAFVGGLVSL